MSIEMKPKILDNCVFNFTPTGQSSEVSVGLSGTHLENRILNADSGPPVTEASYQSYTLSGGALVIDFMALLNAIGDVIVATGLKPQAIHVLNPSGNNPLTFTDGLTNPLLLPGGEFTVPGSSVDDVHNFYYWPECLAAVGSGAKNVAVAGTGTESFSLGVVLG